jgi:hypothetical protein
MKKKPCLSVYIALLFLIFLVVVFPYKEGFETTNTTTTTTRNITTTTNFFEYYWPFSDKFLKSSDNEEDSSTENNNQGNPNIDSRTNNTAGYNDVDYAGFNKTGVGNSGTRYKESS